MASTYVPPSGSNLPSTAPLSKFKVVFLGDSGAGKTSLIKSFIYGKFESNYTMTIGIDFLAKTMYLDDRTVRLQIWDSAGQERFRSIIPSYIRDSSVAVVVYDVTNRVSFTNASRWIEDVRAERGTDVLIALVGNKVDMAERRVVATSEGESKAREEGVMFIECSARTGDNVMQLFRNLATALPGNAEASGSAATGSRPFAPESNLIDVKLSAVPPPSPAADGARSGGCCS